MSVPSRHLEDEPRRPNTDLIPAGKHPLPDGSTVHPCPVGRPEVGQDHAVAGPPQLGMAAAHVGVRQRPRRTRGGDRSPGAPSRSAPGVRRSGRARPGRPPSASSRTSASTVNRPALSLEPSKISTSTGPTNEYPSALACSRAASESSRERASMKLENRSTSAGARVTAKTLGAMRPAHAHPAVQVHLARQPPPDLYRLEVASERLGQRTLHQTLEALLELLESHGSPQTTGPRRPIRAHGRPDLPTKAIEALSRPGYYSCPVARASGGIGRRAGFRFLCPKGCGGSSPPSPTL